MPRDVSRYVIDGQPVPSVTECLDIARFVDLSRIPAQILEDARIRGTHVHTWLEMLIATPEIVRGLAPPDFIAGYVAAWETWRVESKFRIENVEGCVVDEHYRYAGTFDVEGWINGVRAIVDYKARYGITPEIGPQTAGYLGAFRQSGRCDAAEPVSRYALLLRSDGTYRFVEQTNRHDLHAFRAAVLVTHWQLANRVTSLDHIRSRAT